MEENLKSEIFKKRLSMVSGSSYEYEDLKSKNDILTYIQSIRLVLLNKDFLSENI